MEEEARGRDLRGLTMTTGHTSFARYMSRLKLNYRFLTPLVSRLGAAAAYRVNALTGLVGKPADAHTSFLYDKPAAPVITGALKEYLGLGETEASLVTKAFFRYETRMQLENLWMMQGQHRRLASVIDGAAVSKLASRIRQEGPLLLLSAHTVNYVALLWALSAGGTKIAFLMTDPAAVKMPNQLLQQTVIDSADTLRRMMPILFTNHGNTVSRSVELVRQGYSLLIHLDVLGYRGKEPSVTFLGRRLGLPTGCLRIFEETRSPAEFVCTYTRGLSSPYGICSHPLDTSSGSIDLSGWAAGLESVVRRSPESWMGWLFMWGMV